MPGILAHHKKFLPLLVCILTACNSAKVTLKTDWPRLAVTPLPITVAVVYDDSILSYEHSETPSIGRSWTIDLQGHQKTLFQRTFEDTFAQVIEINDLVQAERLDQQPLAGILIPRLKAFQFSTPAQTRRPEFEVWIQYQIDLLDAGGSLLKEWNLSAYGKEQSDNPRLPEKIMLITLKEALRDFSAGFSLNVRTLPEIQSWLEAFDVDR